MERLAKDTDKREIYLFIAELNGYKSGTEQGKVDFGLQCHIERKLHNLDLSLEEDRSELNENIWLERLYDELDNYAIAKLSGLPFTWTVPIELDMSASILGIIGTLLGDERLLTMTNMHGTELVDPWYIEGVPKSLVKASAMQQIYGSSRSTKDIWDTECKNSSLSYTSEMLATFNREMTSGALGLAIQFKNFILGNVVTKESMDVTIAEETFTVKCNRFKNVGDYTTTYDIFDTTSARIRRIHHTKTRKEADLNSFTRFWVTCLIHNLDSQVMNNVIGKTVDKYDFAIDIHDAVVTTPSAAVDVKTWFAEEIDSIYENRKSILANFFNSIGITSRAKADWDRLQSNIVPVSNFKCRLTVLK
jgi:hypothetical protein